ncbi:hypothetical protein D9M68_923000 [compost metagenome]
MTEEIATGSFETIIGTIKLAGNRMSDLWLLGQWQEGTFVGIAPPERQGARAPLLPKPDWA